MKATQKRPSGADKKVPEKTGALSPAQVRDLARQHTMEALNTLLEIMRDRKAHPRARAEATKELRLRLCQLWSRCSGQEAQGEGR